MFEQVCIQLRQNIVNVFEGTLLDREEGTSTFRPFRLLRDRYVVARNDSAREYERSPRLTKKVPIFSVCCFVGTPSGGEGESLERSTMLARVLGYAHDEFVLPAISHRIARVADTRPCAWAA